MDKNSEKLRRRKLIQQMLNVEDTQLDDEELTHLLLSKTISVGNKSEKETFGQKSADMMANFAGSWAFVICFLIGMIAWMLINTLSTKQAFDPYPFILLNLVLSCIAAIQAPLIMMSQNRQEKKDRQRSENDYLVNLKSEYIVADMHHKLDEILKNQKKILQELEKNKTNN